VIFGLLIIVGACSSDNAVSPITGVDVSVDSAVYHLQPFFSSYWINVRSTITNSSDHDIFISRSCYDGQRLVRADPADERQLLLGQYSCIEEDAIPPLRIGAGTEYSYTWRVLGSNSSQTRPPITIDDNTGRLAVTFVLTDSFGRRLTTVASQAFDVVPPIPQENRDPVVVTSGIGLRIINDSVFSVRGADRSYATVNLRVFNRRSEAIAVAPCGWKIEQKEGASWNLVDAAHCPVQGDDRAIQAGDSSDFPLRIEDAPETRALYHREPLVTGVYHALIEASAGGDRFSAESNTFALFIGGYRLPDITGVITPSGSDSLSALVEEDPNDRGAGARTTLKTQVVNIFSLLDRSKAHEGCVVSVWYDPEVPVAATYPVVATANDARAVRCPDNQ
jgi:hypothetical protein